MGRFWTATLVWIQWWLWNDAQSLKQHRGGALLFFKVIRQISRSCGTKKLPILIQIERFWTVTPVWLIHGFEMMYKAWCSIEEVPYCFPRSSVKFHCHMGQKKTLIFIQIGRFRTVDLVLIQWWLWNDARSLEQHWRGALSFFKVIRQISRSHRTKKWPILTRIERFRIVTLVWIHRWI